MKTNEDKDMKPTLKGHNYTKFSYRERSSLLSHSSLEYMYFKGRTEVEVGDLIFCREIFPYLESSLIQHKIFLLEGTRQLYKSRSFEN